MEEIKEFSINMLEEIDDKYSEMEEITIDVPSKNGTIKTKLFINKFFHPKKIRECVKELILKMEEMQKYKDEKETYNNIYEGWLMLLIIKHFSSLEIPNEFTKQLAIFERLISTEILVQIFSKYDKNEIEKVASELNFIVEKLNIRLEAVEKLQKEKELTNKE